METIVSFPGFGIDQLTLNKAVFTLGNVQVRWYGVMITLGIVLAFLYSCYRGKKNEGIIADDVIDIGLLTVVLGVIGSRVYYVLTDSGNTYDSFLDVISLWNGGLAIYGAIIGGCLGILIMCFFKRISFRKLFDMAAPGVIIAQAVGRWGNFFNGEAYGYEITDTSLYYFFNQVFKIDTGEGTIFHLFRMGLTDAWGETTYYHPTFLYECIWNVIGFVLLNLFYKHKKFDGHVALCYFAWYGFGRMFLEGLRTDSLYITGTNVRVSQFLGLLSFLVAVGLMIFGVIYAKKRPEKAFVPSKLAPSPVLESCKKTVKGWFKKKTADETEKEENGENDENGEADENAPLFADLNATDETETEAEATEEVEATEAEETEPEEEPHDAD